MTENESTPAETQAAHTTPAEHTPAEHHQDHYQEQPAHEETPADYDEHFTEPDHEGDQPEKRKKASGAQRAKAQREYFQSELSAREQRIAELERYIGDLGDHARQSDAERHADTQKKRDDAHKARLKETRESVRDFDRVMRSMAGVNVRDELISEIKESDKSALLAYHLAAHPEKLAELNHMPERQRAREIGRLEATLKLPTGKKKTSAPPPPTNLSGGANPHANPNTGPSDMRSFATWLKKDLDARKRR